MGHTEITRIHTKNNPWIQKLNFSGPLEFQDPQNFCILDKEEKTEKNKIKNEQKNLPISKFLDYRKLFRITFQLFECRIRFC